MLDRERFDALLAILDELVRDNARVPIVVEGRRDVESLRRLGCQGPIHCLHAGVPLLQLAERLARETREVVLLTDWDRKGDVLFEQLETAFAINSVRLHGDYRGRLAQWLHGGQVPDVESLAGYVGRHLERLHGRTLGERVAGLG